MKTIIIISFIIISGIFHQVEATTPLRICGGVATGNFNSIANEISKRVGDNFTVTIVPSNGSLDNRNKLMNNECDIAPSQSDVSRQHEIDVPESVNSLFIISDLYVSYAHVFCPAASGWFTIKDVAKGNGTLIVGPKDAGAAQTWNRLRKANPIYENIKISNIIGGMSSISMVKDSKDTCMLWLAGLNSTAMKVVNNLSANNAKHIPSIRIMDIDDIDMISLKQFKFERISRISGLSSKYGLYDNLIYNGWIFNSITIPTVDILMFARVDYLNSIGSKQDYLIDLIQNVHPDIWGQLVPKSVDKPKN